MTKQTITEPVCFDYIIIGFGKAGKTLASFYADKGQTVAMIEKSAEMYGGTCINVACIPSKSLVKSSRQSKELQLPDFPAKAAFYRQAIEEKSNLTAMLRGKNYNKLAQHPKIKVYTGKGSFISEKEIEVETETEILRLQAEKIIINTGSLPFFPGIEGLVGNPRVYTSESLMDLTRLPERLLIIGGGRISLEFASIYSGFGSQVTVLNRGPRLLKQEDQDIAEEITSILQQAGIHFEFNAEAESVSYDLDQAVVTLRDARGDRRQIRVDAVLVATGRTANTKELNLSAAGVETSKTGAVKVDAHLRTTRENIWAVGDVADSPQFTYISLDDYRIVKSQFPGEISARTTENRGYEPECLFIDPAYARVGLNEQEARQRGYEIRVKKLPVAAIPKAQLLQQPQGMLKAIVDAKNDRILGAMLFCVESYELINLVKLAMDAALPYTMLRDRIYTHPTMSEAFNDLFDI